VPAPVRPLNDPKQYDDLADAWWDPRGRFAMLHWIAEARARHVPPAARDGAVLLDLACGAGLLAPHVADRGYRHVGLDLSALALAQARDHGVVPLRGDVLHLPFRDASADVVCAGEVLEHVADPDRLVHEACRVPAARRHARARHHRGHVVGPLLEHHGRPSASRAGPPSGCTTLRCTSTATGCGSSRPGAASRCSSSGCGPAHAPTGGLAPQGEKGCDAHTRSSPACFQAVAHQEPALDPAAPRRPAREPPRSPDAHERCPRRWTARLLGRLLQGPLRRRAAGPQGLGALGHPDPARRRRPHDRGHLLLGHRARMQRFVAEAMPLGKEAVGAALADAGVAPEDVGLFTVVSCTGYATPGLDILLARDLGMDDGVQRLHVGHMGCYAALPGPRRHRRLRGRPQAPRRDALRRADQPARAAATDSGRSGEPTPEDLQQMVAHALFSDAAAAVVLEPGSPRGLQVVDTVARTDASTADHMTWDVTDLGFKMGLSPAVPDVLARHARPVVEQLLSRHGLAVEDVAGWAIHPGGRKIVEVVGEVLDLDEELLAPSYDVLRDVGNCSSATVLMVLERLQETRDLRPAATSWRWPSDRG
jgi:predicted naringenin-chalcone synthase/SAM-dependent methyltransferase